MRKGRSGAVAEELLTKGLSDHQRETACGVSIDMSAPCIKAIKKLLPHADIVHDKFHISQHLNNAVDPTRRQENKELFAKGDKFLVGTKYVPRLPYFPCSLRAQQFHHSGLLTSDP